MLVFSVVASCLAVLLAVAAFLTSLAAFGRTNDCLKASEDALKVGAELAPLKERLEGLDDAAVRAVMGKGGDASVEAVLQTAQRLMDMDPDDNMGLEEALGKAREMHKL